MDIHIVARLQLVVEVFRYLIDPDCPHFGMGHAQGLDRILDGGIAGKAAGNQVLALLWREKVRQATVKAKMGQMGLHGSMIMTFRLFGAAG